jgi:hypothetical protein
MKLKLNEQYETEESSTILNFIGFLPHNPSFI